MTKPGEFKVFADIVKKSKDFEGAFLKIKSIKDVPYWVAILFRKRYDPEKALTPEQTFRKFYDETKETIK